MMSKNDLVGEVVIPGHTLQAFLQGKHTVTMEDSFEVVNKGETVIGNDKKPCVLNLKMRLVVPDEEASPPVTPQRSLTAQHSEAKPAVKSRGGESGSASDAERKEEGRKKKEEEERKAREDAKAAAAAAEASFLVKLKEEQDRKSREEEEKKKAYWQEVQEVLAIKKVEEVLTIKKSEEALLKSQAEQEAAEKAAADAKVVILANIRQCLIVRSKSSAY
jgi:translation initiation factor IF-2